MYTDGEHVDDDGIEGRDTDGSGNRSVDDGGQPDNRPFEGMPKVRRPGRSTPGPPTKTVGMKRMEALLGSEVPKVSVLVIPAAMHELGRASNVKKSEHVSELVSIGAAERIQVGSPRLTGLVIELETDPRRDPKGKGLLGPSKSRRGTIGMICTGLKGHGNLTTTRDIWNRGNNLSIASPRHTGRGDDNTTGIITDGSKPRRRHQIIRTRRRDGIDLKLVGDPDPESGDVPGINDMTDGMQRSVKSVVDELVIEERIETRDRGLWIGVRTGSIIIGRRVNRKGFNEEIEEPSRIRTGEPLLHCGRDRDTMWPEELGVRRKESVDPAENIRARSRRNGRIRTCVNPEKQTIRKVIGINPETNMIAIRITRADPERPNDDVGRRIRGKGDIDGPGNQSGQRRRTVLTI